MLFVSAIHLIEIISYFPNKYKHDGGYSVMPRSCDFFHQFASPYSANYGRGYAISIAALVEREMGDLLPLILSNGSTSIGRMPQKCVAKMHPEVFREGTSTYTNNGESPFSIALTFKLMQLIRGLSGLTRPRPCPVATLEKRLCIGSYTSN